MQVFQRVNHLRQKELSVQFHWLSAVQAMKPPPEVGTISLSVFDHWLSEPEALELLPATSTAEQAHRDSLHRKFLTHLLEETETLSFIWRGRRKEQLRFRSFTSQASGVSYLLQEGSRAALPSLSAAYYRGYDDTNHIYFTNPIHTQVIGKLAAAAGLHVLS